MAPTGSAVGGAVVMENPAFVFEHPGEEGAGEIEEDVVGFSFDAPGVAAGFDGFAGGAGEEALAVPDEDDAFARGGIPAGAEAVEFDGAALPEFPVAAAAIGEGGIFFKALESGGDELVAAGMAGVASPEAHGLGDAGAEVGDEAAPARGRRDQALRRNLHAAAARTINDPLFAEAVAVGVPGLMKANSPRPCWPTSTLKMP